MNYLAHLFLAGKCPESIVGNFLGDFVKGPISDQFSEPINDGIRLHRKIDSFSDQHPLTLKSRNLFPKPTRRFAGIIVDVSYDHFLSRHWHRYSNIGRARFIQSRYQVLMDHWAILPDLLREKLPLIIDQDWLASYYDLKGIDLALKGLSRRVKNGEPIATSITEIKANYRQLESDFLAFFPALIGYVESNNGGVKLTADRTSVNNRR